MKKEINNRMKKVATLFLCFILLCSYVIPVAEAFNDTEGHWADAAISTWSNNGIISGANGFFRPNDSITRGEMAKIISYVLNLSEETENTFKDVDLGDWYASYILRCNAANILNGYDGYARPKEKITRQEAMLMLARAFALPDGDAKSLETYVDADKVADWAIGAVAGMVESQTVFGTDGNHLAPASNLSRAAAVTIIDRTIEQFINEPGEYELNASSGMILINCSDVTISGSTNTDILITQGASAGEISFENVSVGGTVTIIGAGIEVKTTASSISDVNIIGEGTSITEENSNIDSVGESISGDFSGGSTDDSFDEPAGDSNIPPIHNHTETTEWSKNETHHWKDCSGCDEKISEAVHDWNEGRIDVPATDSTTGAMTYTCIICGATEEKTIPAYLVITDMWFNDDCTLEWNAPGKANDPSTEYTEYEISFPSDVDGQFEPYCTTYDTAYNLLTLPRLTPGTYNKIEITAYFGDGASDGWVGDTQSKNVFDCNFTITEAEPFAPVSVAFDREKGEMAFEGLSPNTIYSVYLSSVSDSLTPLVYTDVSTEMGKGQLKYTIETNDFSSIVADGYYLVREYSNVVADGTSCSYTVSNRGEWSKCDPTRISLSTPENVVLVEDEDSFLSVAVTPVSIEEQSKIEKIEYSYYICNDDGEQIFLDSFSESAATTKIPFISDYSILKSSSRGTFNTVFLNAVCEPTSEAEEIGYVSAKNTYHLNLRVMYSVTDPFGNTAVTLEQKDNTTYTLNANELYPGKCYEVWAYNEDQSKTYRFFGKADSSGNMSIEINGNFELKTCELVELVHLRSDEDPLRIFRSNYYPKYEITNIPQRSVSE